VDVLDEGGAGGGAVGLPQLGAAAAVVGREEQRAVDVPQVVRAGAGGAEVDVLDEGGAGGSPVRLPQLVAVAAVVGPEEQGAVAVRQVGREWPWRPEGPVRVDAVGGVGVDVLDEGGAGGGAVRLPQLVAVAAVVGREEQRAAHVREVADGPPGG